MEHKQKRGKDVKQGTNAQNVSQSPVKQRRSPPPSLVYFTMLPHQTTHTQSSTIFQMKRITQKKV